MGQKPTHPNGQSRRTVMKAIGLGAGLSAVGGTAAAQSGYRGVPAQVDEDDESGGNGTGTVHDVETIIRGPPTAAGRPADFFYRPTGLHIDPGDVIRFVFTTPDHNVVSYHPAYGMRRRVPLGVDAFSSPLLGWTPESIPGDMVDPPAEGGEGGEGEESGGSDGGPQPDTWLHSFDVPGVYDLVCSPHEGFGMAMRVVVGDVTDAPFETSDPNALPEPRIGPVGLARVTLTDPALQPSAIVEAGTVDWDDLEAVQSGGSGGGDGSGGNGGDGSGGNGGDGEDSDGDGSDGGGSGDD
ncbi:cupredoxin domain-containing protein [Halobaculum limi]|uniref:cupredoxin domain-containing protein n=1 Tax=Halobaculum limi TaxID=3031916 RepID=UPI002405CA90|nr:plastocyanin/azurin family copper-binding protein [Halobaculum sp. YSMS11]